MQFTFLCPQFRSNVDKREALENLDLIFLCLDEIVERGYATNTFCQPLFYVYFDLGTGYVYYAIFVLFGNWIDLLCNMGKCTQLRMLIEMQFSTCSLDG